MDRVTPEQRSKMMVAVRSKLAQMADVPRARFALRTQQRRDYDVLRRTGRPPPMPPSSPRRAPPRTPVPQLRPRQPAGTVANDGTILSAISAASRSWPLLGVARRNRSMAIVKRHEALLELIRSGTYSCPKLAEELAVSLPTVSRDIVFLRRQGYGIESVRRRTGWAYELTCTPDSQRRSPSNP